MGLSLEEESWGTGVSMKLLRCWGDIGLGEGCKATPPLSPCIAGTNALEFPLASLDVSPEPRLDLDLASKSIFPSKPYPTYRQPSHWVWFAFLAEYFALPPPAPGIAQLGQSNIDEDLGRQRGSLQCSNSSTPLLWRRCRPAKETCAASTRNKQYQPCHLDSSSHDK